MNGNKKLTQAEKIALKLRNMIILKELKAGERINQEKISKKLGVSKIPFREALKVLEAEGLAYSEPYRGTFVSNISQEYLKETFFLRSILEGISCSQATSRFNTDSTKHLQHLLDMSRKGVETEDYERFIHYAEAFHDYIHEHSGYSRLPLMIHNLNVRSLALKINPKEHCERSICEHEFIFERIREKDVEGAGNAMRMHVQRSGMDTVKELLDNINKT